MGVINSNFVPGRCRSPEPAEPATQPAKPFLIRGAGREYTLFGLRETTKCRMKTKFLLS